MQSVNYNFYNIKAISLTCFNRFTGGHDGLSIFDSVSLNKLAVEDDDNGWIIIVALDCFLQIILNYIGRTL